jgi:hypothetical protein
MTKPFSDFYAALYSGLWREVSATWLIAVLFELLILWRGFACKMLAKYPFFYISLFMSFAGDLLVFAARRQSPDFYMRFYWSLQFITLFAACGIVLDIFRRVLSGYPGADRFARVTSVAVFVSVVCFSLIYPSISTSPTIAASVINFERDIRTVQAIFLFVILMIIIRYRIEPGRNVMGMMGGYGLYIFVSLMSLAIRAYAGRAFDQTWRFAQPLAYNMCLAIWAYSLWAYASGPAPDSRILESDYEALAAGTKGALGAMRGYLGRSMR